MKNTLIQDLNAIKLAISRLSKDHENEINDMIYSNHVFDFPFGDDLNNLGDAIEEAVRVCSLVNEENNKPSFECEADHIYQTRREE